MADATYKLVHEGYPVLTIGTTDKSKQFHPFGLAITYDEQTEDFEFIFKAVSDLLIKIHDYIYKPTALIADNAPAITNGFKHAFGSYSKRVSCWAHVIRNIDSQLKTIKNEKDKIQIRLDICSINYKQAKYCLIKASYFFRKNGMELILK